MSTISINKSTVTKKGFITLYIRVRVDRRNISVPLNIKLKQNQWRGRVVNHFYASDLKRWLNGLLMCILMTKIIYFGL